MILVISRLRKHILLAVGPIHLWETTSSFFEQLQQNNNILLLVFIVQHLSYMIGKILSPLKYDVIFYPWHSWSPSILFNLLHVINCLTAIVITLSCISTTKCFV